MDPDPKQRALSDNVAQLALPVLVERLGGAVEITEAEYEALWERYGGRDRIGVKAEYEGATLRLTLVSKPGPASV